MMGFRLGALVARSETIQAQAEHLTAEHQGLDGPVFDFALVPG